MAAVPTRTAAGQHVSVAQSTGNYLAQDQAGCPVPAEDTQHGSQLGRHPVQNHTPRTLVIAIQVAGSGELHHETQSGNVAVLHTGEIKMNQASLGQRIQSLRKEAETGLVDLPGDSQAPPATANAEPTHPLASISVFAQQSPWADRVPSASRR
jgi:hypothetical protein